ncbi:hypothetical protein ABZ569_21020 [Streptomyces albus]|uniref:baeRF2 domain-containing protein n=1 Tax=Streptomyces albus TaxID=1888 RepID=UPI0033F2C399
MRLPFLDPLYATEGAVASVYLDTSRDTGDPDRAVELRWRHARQELTAQGADARTLAALADGLDADREVADRHGRALFCADGQLVLAEELPQPPARDTARYSRVPDAMPLAVQHAPDLPYLAVSVTRQRGTGGRPAPSADTGPGGPASEAIEGAPGAGDEIVVGVQAGRWPMSRVAPGPVTWHRFPADAWQRGAARLAGTVNRMADESGAQAIVVRGEEGDGWAQGVFVNRLPSKLASRVITVEGTGPPGTAPGRALLEDDLATALDGRLNERDLLHIDRFLAQRARDRAACEGMTAAVAALQRGQVEALLVNLPGVAPQQLWGGPRPTHIAASEEDLWVFGAPSARTEPVESLLIRAVVGTGAELVVVPRDELALADGVGVLLRYAAPAAP